MTPPNMPDAASDWYLSDNEPGHLDGHTIEELNDYLDRGRVPANLSIDTSPACQIALASLERLSSAMSSLLQDEADRADVRDDSWVGAIMDGIVRDARSGRDIPLEHPSPHARLFVTEGAVRGLVRAAGDTVANLIVGRCRLDGDLATPGAPITIAINASIYRGESIPALAEQLRQTVAAALSAHTELTIAAIDVTIQDIYLTRHDPEIGQDTP
ncbi:Asp23/Gls24 family envelope stress response protein [Cryobacterium sp. MDB1-18-2]|uniref:Asp23/Gls24 family envelope stress response protein n=1 Tax=Cryobacterium sp. MDB1-18-2 TaxID=1259169 RepID=UPI001F540649|nr:Asp23/Gls24 family envelope stress response protein [Cryobacterium sp. MDB1-18-2]